MLRFVCMCVCVCVERKIGRAFIFFRERERGHIGGRLAVLVQAPRGLVFREKLA